MANPNRAAAAAFNRKWDVVFDHSYNTLHEAEQVATAKLAEFGEGHRKSVKPFRIGKRAHYQNGVYFPQQYNYAVRIYHVPAKRIF